MNRTASLAIPLAFVRRDFFEAKSYHFAFYFDFFATLLNCVVLFFLAKLIGPNASPYLTAYGGDFFAFLILGEAIYRLMEVGINSFSDAISREANRGTLELLFTTQVGPSAAILSSALWPVLFAVIRFGAYLLFGILFFHLDLANANLLGVGLVLGLTFVIHASLGIAAAGVLLITKRGDVLTTLTNYLSWVFGGVYFPVSLLPDGFRWISDLLPLTYALDAIRQLVVEGVPLVRVATDCYVLLGFALVLIPTSLLFFKIGFWKAQMKGDLSHY